MAETVPPLMLDEKGRLVCASGSRKVLAGLKGERGTATLPEIVEVGEFRYERRGREVRTREYYVVSDGTYLEEGEGTRENPWKSLAYGLEMLSCALDFVCEEAFVRIHLSGVYGERKVESFPVTRNCRGKVIITTDGEKVRINPVRDWVREAIFDDCVFQGEIVPLNMDGNNMVNDGGTFCDCEFRTCFVSGKNVIECFGFEQGPGFYVDGGYLYNSAATGPGAGANVRNGYAIGTRIEGGSIGFSGGGNTVFVDCSGNGYADGGEEQDAAGFQDIPSSVFVRCNGKAESLITTRGYAAGFRNCTDGLFRNCSGEGEYTVISQSPIFFFALQCGFLGCERSAFSNCRASESKMAGVHQWDCDTV